jgi:beta-glucosidase
VTLHHFTSPRWLISQGGWENEHTPAFFARYCRHVMQELGDLLPLVCTINEANLASVIASTVEPGSLDFLAAETPAPVPVGSQTTGLRAWMAQAAQQFGVDLPHFHPFLFARSVRARQVILAAHQQAREAIKEVNPATLVGLTLALPDLQAAEGGEERVRQVEQEIYRTYVDATVGDDFLGVQVYTRTLLGPTGVLPDPAEAELTQMGYEFYPEALEGSLRRIARHTSLPLLITENGLATDDDTRRIEYLRRAIAGIERCLHDGLPVIGYLYWSALDNFEWMLGFEKHFGLIGVNRQTQERTVKASARFLGNVARTWQHAASLSEASD